MRLILAVVALWLCASAWGQAVPFYVDNSASSAVIPVSFNGVAATTVPESWAVSALVDVQYDGITKLNLIGENAILSGSGRVPQPSRAIVTITASSVGLAVAVPTLLSSAAGAAPFTVYFDPTGTAWIDSAYTVPLPRDIYGNPIDPSTATFNADGTVATAGTLYIANPAYQLNGNWPCLSDGATVYAIDCQSNPTTYYGPPITNWLHVCKDLKTTNPDGSSTEQYQACALTYRDPSTQVAATTYDTPAYRAGAAAVDVNGAPVTFNCVQVYGGTYAGKPLYYPACSYSGSVPRGIFLLLGAGTTERCGINSGLCGFGGTTVSYLMTLPSAPPPPPPPPCTDCGD